MRPSDRLEMSFSDAMLRHEMESGQQSPRGPADEDSDPGAFRPSPLDRRKTIALQAQEDVCFPQEGLSDIADDEPPAYRMRARRRRGKWPDLSILDEWSRFEKEGRSEERRA